MVGVEGDVRELEPSRAIRGSRAIESTDRIADFDLGIGNNGSGRIEHGAVDRTRVPSRLRASNASDNRDNKCEYNSANYMICMHDGPPS